jgi:AcrR family transcriptional regulator
VRTRILREAWKMIEAGRIGDLTMAAVGNAAGVSRQTVYVQFGSRAGLLVEMVRERDATNPRGRQLAEALERTDPVDALEGLTRVLARWWKDINPIAQALFSAALVDEAARAAWEDRMEHLHALAGQVVEGLHANGQLAPGWSVASGTEWLAGELNPLGWVLLVEGTGWSQRKYEERMTAVVRHVLVAGA